MAEQTETRTCVSCQKEFTAKLIPAGTSKTGKPYPAFWQDQCGQCYSNHAPKPAKKGTAAPATAVPDRARIKVSVGRTYNTGNFESIRLDISIEDGTGTTQGDLFRQALEQLNADAEYLGLKETKHP